MPNWLTCIYSALFGSLDEAGRTLRDDGFTENYGCVHPEIINSQHYPVTQVIDGSGLTPIAHLHGIGRDSDPEVIAALTKSCEGCQYYHKR